MNFIQKDDIMITESSRTNFKVHERIEVKKMTKDYLKFRNAIKKDTNLNLEESYLLETLFDYYNVHRNNGTSHSNRRR